MKLDITVKNSGSREGDEVVMVYHVPGKLERPAYEAGALQLPQRRLLDFARVSLPKQGQASLTFHVNASSLGLVDTEGNTCLFRGNICTPNPSIYPCFWSTCDILMPQRRLNSAITDSKNCENDAIQVPLPGQPHTPG